MKKWRFRDDGTQGEELSGVPNGFREFVAGVTMVGSKIPIETLVPNREWIDQQYTLDQLARWPGVEVYEDSETTP